MRALLLCVLCAAGCGIGHSQAADDGGTGPGGDDGGGGGAHDGGLVSGCPSSPPASGAACHSADLRCEYGSDPSIACNTVAHCVSGAWSVTPPEAGNCPTPMGSKSCPSTYASVPEGSACDHQGLECGYPQGYCVCTESFSGPPMIDASHAPLWYCDTTTKDCPSPRPHAGSPCSKPSQYCDYGVCNLPGGAVMICTGGAWQDQEFACPLAGGGVR
jgi:hypothetical protein